MNFLLRNTYELPAENFGYNLFNCTLDDTYEGVEVLPLADWSDECLHKFCIRKCCPFGSQLYMTENYTALCINTITEFTFDDVPFESSAKKENNEEYKFIFGWACDEDATGSMHFNFNVFNGGLVLTGPGMNRGEILSILEYCIDFVNWNDVDVRLALVCYPEYITVNRGFVFMSLMSFIVTTVMHIVLDVLRNSTIGLCLLSHTVSLFMADTIIVLKPKHFIHADFDKYQYLQETTRRTDMVYSSKCISLLNCKEYNTL